MFFKQVSDTKTDKCVLTFQSQVTNTKKQKALTDKFQAITTDSEFSEPNFRQ